MNRYKLFSVFQLPVAIKNDYLRSGTPRYKVHLSNRFNDRTSNNKTFLKTRITSPMNELIKIVSPFKTDSVRDKSGNILDIPQGWAFLPAGDPGITRKVTAAGVYWRVQIRKGKRDISLGVWAPLQTIENARIEMENTRSTDSYKKSLISSKLRRDKKQDEYSREFCDAVKEFLSFAECYKEYESKMADAVTEHAIPVGSGTVARTTMIPLEERAAKAVIAWMRHKTTGYDTMKIPFIKGKRREVRRLLYEVSMQLLSQYRNGDKISISCPLKLALDKMC
jgi:hypothetical protein